MAVDSGGCSGFAYQFELDDEVNDDDRIYEHQGAKVIVDEASVTNVQSVPAHSRIQPTGYPPR